MTVQNKLSQWKKLPKKWALVSQVLGMASWIISMKNLTL